VSESFTERIFSGVSAEGSGPLTRSITDAATSGFISDRPSHWSVEPFIPIETSDLVAYLQQRPELSQGPNASGQSSRAIRPSLDSIAQRINNLLYQRAATHHTEFSKRYAAIDPDVDSNVPVGIEKIAAVDRTSGVIELCETLLGTAGYRKLDHDDIAECVGVASMWGVPLHVDFDLFSHLVVYCRGDIIGTRVRRRLRKLYRNEMVDVPIYQRMVVIFSLKEDYQRGEELSASSVHLRMFKNIPKQDVDMLLPGTSVKLSGVDRAKIFVPTLGGLVISIQKLWRFLLIFAAVTIYSSAVLAGLILAALGYIIRSVFSYFQAKNRYLLNLTRNLYFQKLDANAGVGYRIIQQAHRQSFSEAILAYFALAASDEPISHRKLRRRCERIIREAIEIEVDFRVEPALKILRELDLIDESVINDRQVASLRQPLENE
tara:strand:+ start:35374 stop:36672 length:1299 start_codon:yes stop_codon:yes gene_type:complete